MFGKVPEKYQKQRVGSEGYRVVDIDLDGVCADYSRGLLKFMEKRGEVKESQVPQPDNYNLAKSEGWPFKSTEHYLSVHRDAVRAGLYASLPLYEFADEQIRILSENDVHVRIVTHRLFISGLHRQVVQDTNDWLDRNQIPFMSLCFLGIKDSLSASLHIDDSPSVINNLRAGGENVLIYDQEYNRSIEGERMLGWANGANRILTLLDTL